jgi:hypothetical protein
MVVGPSRLTGTIKPEVPVLFSNKIGLAGAFGAVILLALGPVRSLSGQANDDGWITDFSRSTVSMDEIVSGGPPKDGIPSLDFPRFETVREAGKWLANEDPVAVVRVDGEAKVYPLQILIWHEIVNDEVGGVPLSVTFCPLCNTTLAFRRAFDGKILDFGTTGLLRHSDMVMYDRQTETWWQQATGEGIVGTYAGRKLSFYPAPVLSWKEVKKQLPEAQVLSRETGHRRPYGQNPYVGYDRRRGPLESFFRGKKDNRLPAMERVVTLDGGDRPLAVPFTLMREERVVHLERGGERLVVFWSPGTASALDRERIPWGRDVGSSAVFSTSLSGQDLTFEEEGDGRFRDRETKTVWSLTGDGIEGPLKGQRLDPVAHGNHFWFAWVVFRPETEVWSKG